MASIINASTSGAGGVITTADASGELQLQSGGATVATVTGSGVVVNGSLSATTLVGGGFSNMQVFTSSGTFTVPAGITKVKVTVVGGGGNGGDTSGTGTAQGGAGGGAAIKYVSGLTPLSTVSVTVGGAAGTSSFGAHCSATGGANGAEANGYNTSVGTGSGGDFNVSGGVGGNGVVDIQNTLSRNSFGGMGPLGLGYGYPQETANQNATQPATGFGAGGTGAVGSTTSRSGSAGAPGVVIVEY